MLERYKEHCIELNVYLKMGSKPTRRHLRHGILGNAVSALDALTRRGRGGRGDGPGEGGGGVVGGGVTSLVNK